MPTLTLTPAERRQRRGEAHHLDPVVMIGAEGLTPAVEREVDAALKAHGLIKVRMLSDARDEREATLQALADKLDAAAVQHIGKLLVLWRQPADKDKAEREDRKPGPRIVRVTQPPKHPARSPVSRKVKLLGNQRVTAGGLIKRAKPPAQRSAKKKAGG
ncbi:MAG: YhbY family RNA-binding protein [Proteobacteria bacterium]|nr:YhbY family RNA-binding protein [Pseudomonadota bacterium]